MRKKYDSLSIKNFDEFAKIYNNSNPRDVAKILEQLDERDAAMILKKMNKKKAGKILESMLPRKCCRYNDIRRWRKLDMLLNFC